MYCNQSALCAYNFAAIARNAPTPTGEPALARGQCVRNNFQVGLRQGIGHGRHFWVLLASLICKCSVGVFVSPRGRFLAFVCVAALLHVSFLLFKICNPTTQALARVRPAVLLLSSTTSSRRNQATSSRGPSRGRLSRC